jgi:hypothetical protein
MRQHTNNCSNIILFAMKGKCSKTKLVNRSGFWRVRWFVQTDVSIPVDIVVSFEVKLLLSYTIQSIITQSPVYSTLITYNFWTWAIFLSCNLLLVYIGILLSYIMTLLYFILLIYLIKWCTRYLGWLEDSYRVW